MFDKPPYPSTQLISGKDPLNSPEPFKDPAKVCKALGSLVVVGEEEIVEESDGQPDQVGTEEEELAGDELHPPGSVRYKNTGTLSGVFQGS